MADPIFSQVGDVSAYLDAVAHGYTGTRAEFGTMLANSANYAASAAADALKSEGHAVGSQNGTDVGSSSPYYHNNAKYYAEQAAASAAQLVMDDALSDSSTNAVQNKVINKQFDKLTSDSVNLFDQFAVIPNASSASVTPTRTGLIVSSISNGTYRSGVFYVQLEANTTYTLSLIKHVTSGYGHVRYCESTDGGQTYPSSTINIIGSALPEDTVISGTFTTTTGYLRFTFYCTYSSSSAGNVEYSDVMLNKGYAADFVRHIYAQDDEARNDITIKGYEKAPAIVNAVSGSLARVEDGADSYPFKSAVVGIDAVQAGSGDPSPSNVRAISGWTGMRLCFGGENLFDVTKSVKAGSNTVISINGTTLTITAPTGQTYSGFFGCATDGDNWIWLQKGVRYTLKGHIKLLTTPAAATPTLGFRDANNSFVGTSGRLGDGETEGDAYQSLTPTSSYRVRISGLVVGSQAADHDVTAEYSDIQLVISGNVPSDYTPFVYYKMNTIDWTSAAEMVYGGYFNVLTGELTVTWAALDLGGDIYRSDSPSGDHHFIIRASAMSLGTSGGANSPNPVLCSGYTPRPKRTTNSSNLLDHEIMLASNGTQILIRDDSYETVDAFRAANNGIIAVYELATPVTYQLAPVDLKSLYGINQMWADTGDVRKLEYAADTKLFIQQLTQPDADMVADANITSGSYFMVGNNLYLATAAIAQGADIIPGTNCTATNLAEALNAINTSNA